MSKCDCNGCGNYYNWKKQKKEEAYAGFEAWEAARNPKPPEPEPIQVINEEWDTPVALSAADLLKLEELKVKLEKKGVTVENG